MMPVENHLRRVVDYLYTASAVAVAGVVIGLYCVVSFFDLGDPVGPTAKNSDRRHSDATSKD
jgi:hypothetical protein